MNLELLTTFRGIEGVSKIGITLGSLELGFKKSIIGIRRGGIIVISASQHVRVHVNTATVCYSITKRRISWGPEVRDAWEPKLKEAGLKEAGLS